MKQLKNLVAELDFILDQKMKMQIHYHGLAKLIRKDDGKTNPVAMLPTGAYDISLDDDISFQIYYRELDSIIESDNTSGFGADVGRTLTFSVQLTGLIKGEEGLDYDSYAVKIYRSIPMKLSGREIVSTTRIDFDTRSVLEAEFDGYDLQPYLLEYSAFTIGINIQTKEC